MKILPFMLCVMALSSVTPAVANDAGSVQQMSGTVTIVGADNRPRQAGPRAAIQAGDTITTSQRSEALIKLADDSTVVLRPNTSFQFTEFKYERRNTDSAIMSVLRGTARIVSGLVGRNSPSQFAVRANTATIGIRGTDFEVSVVPEDSQEGRAGVYNRVLDGGTNIRIASGQSLNVGKDQTAFAPQNLRPGEEPLQMLRETPIFLQQGGGLDALIQSITVPIPIMVR